MSKSLKLRLLERSGALALVLLAALLLLLLVRSPLADALALQSPTGLEDRLTTNPPCASQTARGVVFAFLGYQTQADGTTRLAWRVTNPNRRALDALGFTAEGWTRIAPANDSSYTGGLGEYTVRWVADETAAAGPALRFLPQDDWFKDGAQETFTMTVADFDPASELSAWVRSNQQLAVVGIKPADYHCTVVSPTATPTGPQSMLPTPTATPTPPPAWRAENIRIELHPDRAPQFPVEVTDVQYGGQIFDGRLLLLAQERGNVQRYITSEGRRRITSPYSGWLWNTETQQLTRILNQVSLRKPSLSPNGEYLVTTQVSVVDERATAKLILVDLKTGQQRQLPDELVSTYYAWFSKDKLYFSVAGVDLLYDLAQQTTQPLQLSGIQPGHSSGDIWISPYAPNFAAIRAEDEDKPQLYLYIARQTSTGYEAFAHWPTADQVTNFGWSPDGEYLAYKPGGEDISIVNLMEPTQVITAPGGNLGHTTLTWSPDSQMLLYGDLNPLYQYLDLRDPRDFEANGINRIEYVNQAIFVINRDGSGWRQLTTFAESVGHPIWFGTSNLGLAATGTANINRQFFMIEVIAQ